MARPRNALAKRKPCGRAYSKPDDPRELVAQQRVKHLGVTLKQSSSPLAGFLVGILYLRRKINAQHVAAYISYLSISPRMGRSVPIKERVNESFHKINALPFSLEYLHLAKRLKTDIEILHALVRNELTCTIPKLKSVLDKIPLTRHGVSYINACNKYFR